MPTLRNTTVTRGALVVLLSLMVGAGIVRAGASGADKVDAKRLLTGQAAFVDYRTMQPGTFRKITTADLPQPYATEAARNSPRLVARPADAWPQAAPGFKVDLYASDLEGPRQIRVAPNGEFFVAESRAGPIRAL